jgi:hypothetical protein
MRIQASRQRRPAIEGAAHQDARPLGLAERSMLGVVHPDAAPQEAARPKPTPAEAPVAPPAPYKNHRIEENIP